jgi:type II secretory ATPase GspE/PulE/Tfp pilus assembly ATPase PilB-like protein
VLCAFCKEAYLPSPEERRLLGMREVADNLYRPVGCKQCGNKGYKGRMAIMEILVMDSDLDELVARRATTRELRTLALSKGFRPLAEEGIARVLDGSTTIGEVSRAVDLTGRYS